MTRYAVLEGDTVRAVHDVEMVSGVPNLSAQDGEGGTVLVPLADAYPAAWSLEPCPAAVQPGWSRDGEEFSAPPEQDVTPVVPASVTSAQAKIQLLRTPGSAEDKTLLDDVKAGIDAAGGEVSIWFTDARTWERTNPYVAQLGGALNLSAAQVDELFVAAAKIAA